jgi:PIN domain nuclease of toxin-antitoxin system
MLLDTHIWIWAAADQPRKLGAHTKRLLNKAARQGDVFVSSVSAFEIAALATAGRLTLNQPAARWIAESIERGALRVLDLGIDVADDAGSIPAEALSDPIDRLLVATARNEQIPLVTRDSKILEYANRTRSLRVVDASR